MGITLYGTKKKMGLMIFTWQPSMKPQPRKKTAARAAVGSVKNVGAQGLRPSVGRKIKIGLV
jgi:hypothetical protein